MLVAVVDGIGHGPSAALAAELAIGELARMNGGSLVNAVQRCHERLHRTRGVVLSLAQFNVMENSMAWLSVGNVEGRLWRLNARRMHEALLLRGGVVGDHIPYLVPAIVPVAYGDLLILATDGIESSFADDVKLSAPARQIAEKIVERNWQGTDDALVLVARYAHTQQPQVR
jgi:phosphoserine phosphatase RsbX